MAPAPLMPSAATLNAALEALVNKGPFADDNDSDNESRASVDSQNTGADAGGELESAMKRSSFDEQSERDSSSSS